VCLVSTLAAAVDQAPPADGAPTTVVLVTIDTLRADALSFMGCARPTSPFLDALAAKAVVFDRAYSTSSWTVPAIASLFTSLYPSSHGVVDGLIIGDSKKEVWRQTVLSPNIDTMAALFRRAGYRTVGVAANRHMQAGTGFERGFDHYYADAGFLEAEALNTELRKIMASAFGEGWRKTWKTEKTFLWIHYFDPHHPYFPRQPWIETFDPDSLDRPGVALWSLTAPELNEVYSPADEAMTRQLLALYHSEVRYADELIRAIWADLGLDDQTLVVVVADHGEEFGEHGRIGHRRTLYEEVVRVPMMIYWPSNISGGTRVEDVVSVVDLLPTMVELASLEPPERTGGRSLVPLLTARSARWESAAYLELQSGPTTLRAFVGERWKLVVGPGGGTALFDLPADPGERRDVAVDNGPLTRRLAAEFEAWLKSLPAPPPSTDFSSRDQAEIERLRSLGYLGD
jgi:arylsulfatase A-like enzyme